MHKVQVVDGVVYQNDKAVASCHRGWLSGLDGKFMFRARGGNSEAVSFAKHMLKLMTVEQVAAGVKVSSPVEFAAFHGWMLPHFKGWVKKGLMSAEEVENFRNSLARRHAEKAAA